MNSKQSCPVARRLKQARNHIGISQRKLGIAAGIDEASSSARMNQYERGKHVPDYDTLIRLAEVLNVPVTYFYCDDDQDAEFQLNLHQLRSYQRKQISNLVKRVNFDG